MDTWATREWYPALDAAGIDKRGPYCLPHTFAAGALAAGISTFELSRLMGTSLAMIDRHDGHLARDSEQAIRARLDARSDRSGVEMASEEIGDASRLGRDPAWIAASRVMERTGIEPVTSGLQRGRKPFRLVAISRICGAFPPTRHARLAADFGEPFP
jgi:hypothetical protein